MNQNFVALTQHPGELDWLQNSLASAGQVVPAGSASLEELLALLDVTAAGVLFISLGKSNLVSQGALVEGLVSAQAAPAWRSCWRCSTSPPPGCCSSASAKATWCPRARWSRDWYRRGRCSRWWPSATAWTTSWC
ncbi:hypothetical protein ACSES2_28910 [Pseudomonas aeruginosa]